ncbi:MAG TPA: hypothetical protein VGL95_17850, partial [Acetobacteraceae bacterium]
MLSPPSGIPPQHNPPVVSQNADGQVETARRPNAGPGEAAGSPKVYAYVNSDPLTRTDIAGLVANSGTGITAALQGKGSDGYGL